MRPISWQHLGPVSPALTWMPNCGPMDTHWGTFRSHLNTRPSVAGLRLVPVGSSRLAMAVLSSYLPVGAWRHLQARSKCSLSLLLLQAWNCGRSCLARNDGLVLLSK